MRSELASVEKGLALLQELARIDAGMRIGELATAAGVNRTTAYRLCERLAQAGWIELSEKTPASRRQLATIGPRACGLGVLLSKNFAPEGRIQTLVEQLSREVGETVHTGVLDGDSVIHVARAVPPTGLHVAAVLGSRELAHLTALGKATLATLPREEVIRRYPYEELQSRTNASIRTRTALLRELEAIAEQRYAVDDGESHAGVRCLGAPIFDVHGRARFAISGTSTVVQIDGSRLADVAEAVCDAAAAATATLGGTTPPTWSGGTREKGR